MKLEIGDKVILKDNPFAESGFLKNGKKVITDVRDTPYTSGQWVRINGYNDWIDSSFFIKI
jgi:hypothetical protein